MTKGSLVATLSLFFAIWGQFKKGAGFVGQ